ncbi:MAG TPA: hypothetical protein VJG48_02015 [Candidatus Paceibacterota bacterium]
MNRTKTITTLLLSLCLVFVAAGSALAQSELFFGQSHYYSVIFRGNGEAIVYAKLVVKNLEDKPLTEYSFEMPKATPSELVMYQIKLPQTCIRYGYKTVPQNTRVCEQYQDPNYEGQYYSSSYNNGQTEYQKINFTRTGNLYKFSLPTQIEPMKSTAILVAYAAGGYVDKGLTALRFNFETLKVPARIKDVKVTVDVDTDLLLKGKPATVNYNSQLFGVSQGGVAMSPSISSPDMDKVANNIGARGALVKQASNLSPNESFSVKGEYATSWFRLYLATLLWIALIVVAVIAALFYLVRFVKRRKARRQASEPNQASPKAPGGVVSIIDIVNLSVGLLSAVLVVGLMFLSQFIFSSSISRAFGNPFVAIAILIILLILYVLVIFVPGIVIAVKRGWKSGLSVLIAEFLWFIVFLTLYIAFFQAVAKSTRYYY